MITDGKIPVILDTDIGADIDDTWAIAMMLKSLELDVKLIVSDTGDTDYRARLIAKMLDVAGRTDIPVGVGIRQSEELGPQGEWIEDYQLSDYPGEVRPDGVDAIIRTIMDSPETITLICIGPMGNIAEALRREPAIAAKSKFVGMHGSVYIGYGGSPEPAAEYNVRADARACREVFAADWREAVITPVDTCGLVRLEGDRYRRVLESDDPLVRAVIENYRIWSVGRESFDPESASTILFDTVAIYLAFSRRYLVTEKIGISVTDDGFTIPDPSGRAMDVAVNWSDLDAFCDFLVGRLLGRV